ncbi:MAG: hypothetical protein PWP46_2005 [Fusobacteriaceae bacterium]|jgi:GGDEF domain-containing protein|nr:hypothetical protein [Fusobacteriaceae bacterium]
MNQKEFLKNINREKINYLIERDSLERKLKFEEYVNSKLELKEMVKVIFKFFKEIIRYDSAELVFQDKAFFYQDNTFEVINDLNINIEFIELYNRGRENRNIFIINEHREYQLSKLVKPIYYFNEYYGVLIFEAINFEYDINEINVEDELTKNIGTYIHNILEYTKAKEEVYLDNDFEIYNKKYLIKNIEELLENEVNFGLIFVKINKLEKLEKLYGESFMKKILENTSNILKEINIDNFTKKVGRYSDTVFYILIENIKKRIEKFDILNLDRDIKEGLDTLISINFSYGATHYFREKTIGDIDYILSNAEFAVSTINNGTKLNILII